MSSIKSFVSPPDVLYLCRTSFTSKPAGFEKSMEISGTAIPSKPVKKKAIVKATPVTDWDDDGGWGDDWDS